MPKEPESGEVTLPFRIEGNGNLNLKQPVAEDIRQLFQHMGLETRWNTRANRVELKGEADWFNYGDYDSALHNALENIWYGVEDKEKEKIIYKPRSFSDTRLLRSLTGIAQENKVDPFLEYLKALLEPTTPTADREALAMHFIHGVWGVKEGYRKLAAYGFRNLLRAIVHRTLQPGYSYDDMRILKGPEGHGKSKDLKALLPDPQYFADKFSLEPDLTKQIEKTFGKVLIECAELEGMTKADTAKLYAFLHGRYSNPIQRQWAWDSQMQTIRHDGEYGRVPVSLQCLFLGGERGWFLCLFPPKPVHLSISPSPALPFVIPESKPCPPAGGVWFVFGYGAPSNCGHNVFCVRRGRALLKQVSWIFRYGFVRGCSPVQPFVESLERFAVSPMRGLRNRVFFRYFDPPLHGPPFRSRSLTWGLKEGSLMVCYRIKLRKT